MQQEIAREPSSGNTDLQVSSVPFSALAHQSKLFLEYQSDSLSLKSFYPNAVSSPARIDPFVDEVLASYQTDRTQLCDALTIYNANIGAGEMSLRNIATLRNSDTVAVVTGQQAGLFTGPLYTIYKALSAINMAESLNRRGIKAIPVFWIASEDHDYKEVSEASVIDSSGSLYRSEYVPLSHVENTPVGRVYIDGSIFDVIRELISGLPQTNFKDHVQDHLTSAWVGGKLFADAFARNLAEILAKFGMVFIDPLDPSIKTLSSPIYARAVLRADEIVRTVRARSVELVSKGYQAQVDVQNDYFPMFWHDDSGARLALRKVSDGLYRVKGVKREFQLSELTRFAEIEPERFSPGVMVRPVVQDYLLPTVCYFGGGAEIAYFAQNSEVYRVLERPVTPIFHRQSFTVVEAKHRKTLEKYDLELPNLFEGLESILLNVAASTLSADSARVFAEVEEDVNIQLHKLDQSLSLIDPTLAESLGKRRRKILYHIAALRKKTLLAEVRQHETAHRRIESLFTALLPGGQLQERTINAYSFVNRFGPDFVDWIYRSIDLEDAEHRIIYL